MKAKHTWGPSFTIENVPTKIANRTDYPQPIKQLYGVFLMGKSGSEAKYFRTGWDVAVRQ